MLAKKKKKYLRQINSQKQSLQFSHMHLHRETMLHQNKTKHTIISIFFVAVSFDFNHSICVSAGLSRGMTAVQPNTPNSPCLLCLHYLTLKCPVHANMIRDSSE